MLNFTAELKQLIADKSFNKARVYVLNSSLSEAEKYLTLANIQVKYLHDLAEASKSFLLCFYMNRSLMSFEDIITFAKCAYASSIGFGEMLLVEDYLLNKIGLDKELSDEKIIIIKMRFYIAINNLVLANTLYDNLSNKAFNKTVSKEVAYLLLWSKRYDYLTHHLQINQAVMSKDIYKDYLQANEAYKKASVNILKDVFGYKSIYFKCQSVESKKLIITFGYVGTSKVSIPFGVSMLLNEGYDVLHFAQSEHSYYQYLSLDDFKEQFDQVGLDYESRNVFCYGSSLGGYAAIYYATSIGAVAIAGSPRNPLDLIYGQKRFPITIFKHLKFDSLKNKDISIFVFNDPFNDIDKRTMDYKVLNNFKNIKLFNVPFGGHPVTSILGRRKLLKKIILNIIENEEFGIHPSIIPEDDDQILKNKEKYYSSLK